MQLRVFMGDVQSDIFGELSFCYCLQELERRAREEQKQREMEIQRRKMKNINISSPATGDLESLVALPATKRSGSFGSKGSPSIARAAVTDSVSKESSETSSETSSASGTEASSSQGGVKEERRTAECMTNSEKGEVPIPG
jgi:hypothetical protein